MEQVEEIKKFSRFLKEKFYFDMDKNTAARMWIKLFAEDYRKGKYSGFESAESIDVLNRYKISQRR